MALRNIIFWTHLITGLVVGVVVFTMATTGLLMAYEPQIVAFAERDQRNVKAPSLSAARLGLDAIVAEAHERYPGAQPSGLTLRSAAESSVLVQMGQGVSAYFNPYTGEYLGSGSKVHDGMHVVEDIHRRLATGEAGRKVTGVTNASFLVMVLTGLYIWWPKKWTKPNLRAIMLFNNQLQGKARDWNWHNVFGIWCAPLLLITTLTGLIMSYTWASDTLYRVAGDEPPPRMQKMEKPGAPAMERPKLNISFDRLLETVNREVPGWKSVNFRAPQTMDAPVVAYLQEASAPKSFMRSQLSLDAKTGKVVKWEPFSSYVTGRQWRIWARYLHTGEWAGWQGQTLALTGAVGALFLVWTGFALSWRRFFGAKSDTNKTRRKR